MDYIKPQQVNSPRNKNVKVLDVILDEGAGKFAAAIIEWDGKEYVGTRWNGTPQSPIGFPTSRGVPIWQVEHEELGTQLEALFRAKARGEELEWGNELTVEQHTKALTSKGFTVTLSMSPTNKTDDGVASS